MDEICVLLFASDGLMVMVGICFVFVPFVAGSLGCCDELKSWTR